MSLGAEKWSYVDIDVDTVASDEDVLSISKRLLVQNKEAYEVLAK